MFNQPLLWQPVCLLALFKVCLNRKCSSQKRGSCDFCLNGPCPDCQRETEENGCWNWEQAGTDPSTRWSGFSLMCRCCGVPGDTSASMGGTGGVWPLCQPRCAVQEDVRVAALLRHVTAVALCCAWCRRLAEMIQNCSRDVRKISK